MTEDDSMTGHSAPAMEPEPLVPSAAHKERLLVHDARLLVTQSGSHVAEVGGGVALVLFWDASCFSSIAHAPRLACVCLHSPSDNPRPFPHLWQLAPGLHLPALLKGHSAPIPCSSPSRAALWC